MISIPHFPLGDLSVSSLRNGLIGSGTRLASPVGSNRLIYADYTASGRALEQVEDYIRHEVLPYYANCHTEISECGRIMNGLRKRARQIVAASCQAGPDCAVIFTGSGATAGLNRLPHLLGLTESSGIRPVVLVGPYEHHSNILPWREAGAEVVEVDEAPSGGVDRVALNDTLARFAGRVVVGAFSAASNVTGILEDVPAVTRMLKAHGALAVWDYAAAAAYRPMSMQPAIDALVFSPHKLPGGPGASGVLIVRKSAVKAKRPTWPGGGSVSYVSSWDHDYFNDVSLREEAGTPNILGDIRAALALQIRDAIGVEAIVARSQAHLDRAFARWRRCDRLTLLGQPEAKRLPIVSFVVSDGHDVIHHRLVTRMLSDVYGIQAREGCSCAGPYGHRLLQVSRQLSTSIRAEINAGQILAKPGWTRLNFCHLQDDHTADLIIDAVADLSEVAGLLSSQYQVDPVAGTYRHMGRASVTAEKRIA